MIKILRTSAPDILLQIPDPSLKTYASSEVRQSLINMQHGKCCYCERKIDLTDIFPEDQTLSTGSNVEKHIEHFRPKGKDEYRHLTNDWSNLLLACNTCNVNKGQKFKVDQCDNPLCIDPSDPDMDPGEHIELTDIEVKVGPNSDYGKLVPRNNSAKGEWTIANVKLNEGTCRKGRWEKVFEIVKDVLDYIKASPNTEERMTRLRLLDEKRSARGEFALVVREVCRQLNVPV